MSELRPSELNEAMRYCRDITRARARNFYYGLRLLPAVKRDALYALYAWMRQADDLVDDGSAEPVAAGRRLQTFREHTDAVLEGEFGPATRVDDDADPLLWVAMTELCRRYTLEPSLFHDMIDGQLSDLDEQRYDTWNQLVQYCHRVASSVGILCIEIWGYRDDSARALAVERGVAFQLTNILRDYREDYDAGRVYLPMDVFEKHGLAPVELYQWSKPEQCQAMVLDVAGRAQQCYEQSAALDDLISADCRPTLRAMTDIYHGLLERVQRNPACVACGPRIRLNALTKLSIAGRALWRRRFPGTDNSELGAVS